MTGPHPTDPDAKTGTEVRTTRNTRFNTRWSANDELPQIYASEMALGYLNGQIFLTFGELRVPVIESSESAQLEIRPVARIVLSEAAFMKLSKTLGTVSEAVEAALGQGGKR